MRRRFTKQHLRCRSKTTCGRRFKGFAGITRCPSCGSESRLDKWANSKPWRNLLCYCDGPWWSIRAPHKIGTGDCRYNPKNYEMA